MKRKGPRRPDPPRGWSLKPPRGRPKKIPLWPDLPKPATLTAQGVKAEQRAVLARCTGCGVFVSRSKSHVCKGPHGKGT